VRRSLQQGVPNKAIGLQVATSTNEPRSLTEPNDTAKRSHRLLCPNHRASAVSAAATMAGRRPAKLDPFRENKPHICNVRALHGLGGHDEAGREFALPSHGWLRMCSGVDERCGKIAVQPNGVRVTKGTQSRR
jgi:hypothetical protein